MESRQNSILTEDSNTNTTNENEKTVLLRIGDLYWEQDGPSGWKLGQLIGHNVSENTATFVLVNETSGEVLLDEETQLPSKPYEIDLTISPLYPANPLFQTASDMTSLRHLHEAAIAKNLQDRSNLQNQRPYTFVANVLIAVNPLRQIPDPDMNIFVDKPLDRCPPHPYNIAENAYRQLCAVRATMQNQSIIISGESGSGKTETSKIILAFLTARAPPTSSPSSCTCSEDEMDPEFTRSNIPPLSDTAPLSDTFGTIDIRSSQRKLTSLALGERLMQTIPILESFGNAKTHRNHNSSRFGKYMRLQFSSSGSDSHQNRLSGASIDTYLLEKSRLVSQPKGERNFHVFYELLKSQTMLTNEKTLENVYHLKPCAPEAYDYLNQSGCMETEQLNDTENFSNLCEALEFVGIYADGQKEIFKIVAGLLNLGNVRLIEVDTLEGKTAKIADDDVESSESLTHAAELLGVSREELEECILVRRIMTRGSRRGSIYYTKRDRRNAIYSRDTIAKTIYEEMFNWLMVQCASALDYNSTKSDVIPYIGVLDIFGFEDFEPKNRNSFEQLLINYANESLQSLFNTCIFEAEQELYRSEHIFRPTNHSLSFPIGLETDGSNLGIQETIEPEGEMVQYSDNKECLTLISSRHGGLFVTIDNIARMPQPSDRKLNERLHTLFKRNSCFPTPHPKDIRETFKIRHYAGTVTYHIEGFVDKNNNVISDQFEELLARSTSRILTEILGKKRTNSAIMSAKTNAVGSRQKSSGGKGGGSTSNLFSSQMKGLTTELEGTNCNFVRCIKPNTAMVAGQFERPFVVEQLRCSGTVQACEVLRVGLPTRILYAEVVDVYKNVLPQSLFEKFDWQEKLLTQALLYHYDFPTDAYRLGDSRLFFRTGKIDLLDKLLTPPTGEAVEALRLSMVRYLMKKRWLGITTRIVVSNVFLQSFLRCKFNRRAIVLQCMVRQRLARNRVRKIKTQLRMHALWVKFTHRQAIMNAYADRPEDKMQLLDALLSKPYLPRNHQWLLKWLGPLQRVIYLQKRWKQIMAQYLCKRAFCWLLQTVRQKRAILKMQTMGRVVVAKRKFQRLKKARLAREGWRRAYLKVRAVCIFTRLFQRIHVQRLEADNAELSTLLHEQEQRCETAESKAAALLVDYAGLEKLHSEQTIEYEMLQRRVAYLETQLDARDQELMELKLKSKRRVGLVERVIRFFTCSSFGAEKYEPEIHRKYHRHEHDLSTDGTKSSDASHLDELDDVFDDEREIDDEDMHEKESDGLWCVSRFCF